MKITRIEITCAADYESWASDVISLFTSSIFEDERYCITVADQEFLDPSDIDDDWSYVFTHKGQKMVEAWTDRLHRMGSKLFPDVQEFEIENWHYQTN